MRAFLVALLIAAGFGFSGLAQAQVSREVSVELAGYARSIRAATLFLDIDLVGSYDLRFNLRPTAAARALGADSILLRGQGGISDTNLFSVAASYESDDDNIRIRWANGGVTVTGADASRVNQAGAAGALDPASAIMLAMHRTTNTGSCAGTRTVFDGDTLLRASYVDQGTESVSSSGYSGEAHRCHITYQVTEGGSSGSDTAPITLWLAQPISGGPFVPVRLELVVGSERGVFEALSVR